MRSSALVPVFANDSHAKAFLASVLWHLRQAGCKRYPATLRYAATTGAVYKIYRQGGVTEIYDQRLGALVLTAGRGKRVIWCRIHGAES
jgi:hypothetical protein